MLHRRGLPSVLLATVLVGLALAGLVLSAAGIPHHHAGRPGLYNQEHDLSYLATLGFAAPLPDPPASLAVVVVVVLALAGGPDLAPIRWRRHADFRAPPLR